MSKLVLDHILSHLARGHAVGKHDIDLLETGAFGGEETFGPHAVGAQGGGIDGDGGHGHGLMCEQDKVPFRRVAAQHANHCDGEKLGGKVPHSGGPGRLVNIAPGALTGLGPDYGTADVLPAVHRSSRAAGF